MANLDLLVCAATQRELSAFGAPNAGTQDSFVTGVGIPLALAQILTTAGPHPQYRNRRGISRQWP